MLKPYSWAPRNLRRRGATAFVGRRFLRFDKRLALPGVAVRSGAESPSTQLARSFFVE